MVVKQNIAFKIPLKTTDKFDSKQFQRQNYILYCCTKKIVDTKKCFYQEATECTHSLVCY